MVPYAPGQPPTLRQVFMACYSLEHASFIVRLQLLRLARLPCRLLDKRRASLTLSPQSPFADYRSASKPMAHGRFVSLYIMSMRWCEQALLHIRWFHHPSSWPALRRRLFMPSAQALLPPHLHAFNRHHPTTATLSLDGGSPHSSSSFPCATGGVGPWTRSDDNV